MRNTRIKLIVTILDRGRGERAAELFRRYGLRLHYAAPGRGTANSELLDLLGLGETEKDVVLTLAPGDLVPPLLREAGESLQLSAPGRGILFTLPLSAIGGAAARYVEGQARRAGEEEEMEQGKNDLVVVVVGGGCTDRVMEAAKAAGARGGTLLHGRRLGEEGDGGVRPEKEIVAILTPREKRQAILEAVNRTAGAATESRGVLFSLPVEHVLGLAQPDRG